MTRNTQDFIRNYFSKLINHHKNIFGIHKNAIEHKNSYTNKADEIFSFIHLLSQMQPNFMDECLEVLLDDIINLLNFKRNILKDDEKLKEIFHVYEEQSDRADEKEKFIYHFKKEYKLKKSQIEELLNSKFYYLDLYIWDKIHKTSFLKQFLQVNKMQDINSTLVYLQMEHKSKFQVQVDYSHFKLDGEEKYKQEDIEFIKSLVNKTYTYDESNPQEQLIKYKHHIPYFKNMSDENIRNVVTNVQFRRFKKNEIIIKEYDDDKDIHFLVEGEAQVSLNRKELAMICPKTIFGEFSFITERLRSATIQATCPSVVISFNLKLESFDQNPLLYPQLYKNIAEELVKKFYSMNIHFMVSK